MRHSKLLIGTTALALVAGTSMALAQGMAPREPSSPAINQHQGGQERGKAGNAEREGQGTQPGHAQSDRGKRNSDQTTGQAPPSNQAQPEHGQRGHNETPAQQAQPGQHQGVGQSDRGRTGERERNETTGQQSQTPATHGQGKQPQAEPQQGQTKPQGAETQGQAGARVTFTTEQRTRIRETILKSSNAPRAANVNFTISVGTAVPRTLRLAPLPTLIVDVEPAWRGYMYFVVGDEIIVVEPRSLKIVAVIAV